MQKRLYEYKLSLYTKAVQVQNALIEKLKDELNLERSERKYVMELNEKLQDVIRKLRGDLNR